MKRILVMVLFVLAAVAMVAMAEDPWTGTWKLNPEKSKAPGGRIPHPISTNVIDVQGDTMRMVADHTDTEGNLEHVEYTATLDGKIHPVTSTPAGPNPYTISVKRIDARTREFTEVLGTVTISGRDVLSEDGKTFSRIVELKGPDGSDLSVLQFFEKQ
jgi:hypothetical protein